MADVGKQLGLRAALARYRSGSRPRGYDVGAFNSWIKLLFVCAVSLSACARPPPAVGSAPSLPATYLMASAKHGSRTVVALPAAPLPVPRNTAPDACAGFEKLEMNPQPVDLLNGRLRITPLSGFEGEPEDIWVEPLRPPSGAYWRTPDSVLEQRLKFRRGAGELEIYTRDLLALAPENLAATLHRSPEVAGLTVEDIQLANSARLVLATSDELDFREGRAVVALAHSVLPDNTLQVTYVTVNGAVADAGAAGCQALARKLLLSQSPGAQRWERRRRVVELFDMTLTVPKGYAFVRQWSRHGTWGDWDMYAYRVLKFSPLLGPAPELVVTNISTGPFQRDPAAAELPGRLLGKPVVWFETRAPGRIFRETRLERADGASLRLFLTAETELQASELTQIVSSLRWAPPAP